MTAEEMINKMNQIYQKYIEVYRLIPYGGSLDKVTAERLGIKGDLIPLLDKAIKYGQVKAKTKAKLSPKDLEKLIQKENNSPLMDMEKEASQIAFDSLVLKGQAKINNALMDQLKRNYKVLDTLIQDQGVSKTQMKRYLRQVSQDNKQDWDMVIRTELMNKSQEAFAEEIIRGKSAYSDQGADTRVFKRPNPNACPHCKRLYLDQDGRPRVFKLKDLLENGSNVGRKVADWKPVVGVTHPHCQCILEVLPENCILDEKGNISVVKDDKAKD